MSLQRSVKIETASAAEKVLTISKGSAVKIKAQFLHLDELPDGTWRITYSSLMIPDFMKLKSLDFLGLEKGLSKQLHDVTIFWHGLGIVTPLIKVIPTTSEHRMIHLDRDTRTDAWKMIYSKDLIPDPTILLRFAIHRKD